jgi:MtN3 and saliva related transmembrane protein
MEPIMMLGMTAAVFTTCAFLPQVIKTASTRHTKDLSLMMFVLTAIGVALWMTYGIFRSDYPVMIANFLTLSLSLYIIYLKFRYG